MLQLEAVPNGCKTRMQHYLSTWETEIEKKNNGSKAREVMSWLQSTNIIITEHKRNLVAKYLN